MLQNIFDGIYFVDTQRRITFWNKGAERITGYKANEVLGSFCHHKILNHVSNDGIELCQNGCPLHKTIEDGQMREASVYLQHKNGHRVPVNVRTIAIQDDGETLGAIEIFLDNSEKSEILEYLEQYKVLAMIDQLTGLPNRRYINTFVATKIRELSELGIDFGVAILDIDNFKVINDSYGHLIGDEMLKILAQTFSHAIRSVDLVGRWGGEEFVAVFSGVGKKMLLEYSERLRMLAEKSYISYHEKQLGVTVSIGCTLFRQDDTEESAMQRADDLLYKSKHNGKNQITFE